MCEFISRRKLHDLKEQPSLIKCLFIITITIVIRHLALNI